MQQTRLQAPAGANPILGRSLDEACPQRTQSLRELILGRQALRCPLKKIDAVHVLHNGPFLDELVDSRHGSKLGTGVIELAFGTYFDNLSILSLL